MGLSHQYVDLMSSTLNKYAKYYDSADQVIYECTTNLREDFLYIILNDEKILKNKEYLNKLSNLKRNIVCYFTNNVDKINIDKSFQNIVIKFDKLDSNTLLAYAIKKCADNKINIAQDKLAKLVEYCDNNSGILLNELDKIFTLEQANSNVLMDYMLNNGFSDYRKYNLFTFIDMLLNKNQDAFNYSIRITDSPVIIALNMYNKAKKLFLQTRNTYYVKYMKLGEYIYNGIIDGTIKDDCAVKIMLLRVFIE